MNTREIHNVLYRCSKKKFIIFPIDGFSKLYLALYKCDRVTLDGKIRFRTKKLLRQFGDCLTHCQYCLSARIKIMDFFLLHLI